MRRAFLLFAALLMAGCAQNAVLEIELQLPEPPPGSSNTQALVRFALDTDGVDNDIETFDLWTADEGAVEQVSFPLDQHLEEDEPRRSFPSNMRLSIRTGHVDADLLLQIRFCQNGGICAANAPELRYRVEHPFYRGQRTFLRTGPLSPTEGSYAYNREQDWPELCQQPTTVDPNVRVIWRCRIEGCFDASSGQVVSPDYGWCSMGSEPGYTMPLEAECADGGARTVADASGAVLGEVDAHPQHFCERSRGCSVSPGGRPASPLFVAGVAAFVMACARRRAFRRGGVPSRRAPSARPPSAR